MIQEHRDFLIELATRFQTAEAVEFSGEKFVPFPADLVEGLVETLCLIVSHDTLKEASDIKRAQFVSAEVEKLKAMVGYESRSTEVPVEVGS